MITVRKAKLSDVKAIATVHITTWQDAYRGLIPDEYLDALSIDERELKWKLILSDKQHEPIHLVGLVDGKIQGWASFYHCRDADAKATWGELGGIYIHPSAQHLGLGSLLMQAGLVKLKLRGYACATLWVLQSNQKARAFYESKGWKVEGKTKVEQRNGFELHEIRYAITL